MLLGFALVAAACGSSSKNSSETTAPAAETTAAAQETTVGTVAQVTTTVAEKPKPVSGGKVIIGVEAETTSPWTPANMQCDVGCQLRSRTFFEPLVSIDNDGNSVGYLAESLDHNADYSTWTVKLRSGITFSDGTPANADAIIENANRAMNSFLVGAAIKPFVKLNADGKTWDITKVDDLTVTMNLNGPWVDFPETVLSGQAGFLASPKWLAAIDAASDDQKKILSVQPVGTGPFILSAYNPGNNLIVKKNPTYWRKDADGNALPYLDEIEFRVIPDAQTRAQGLESGDLDVIHTTNGESIANFRSKADQFPMIEADYLGETRYLLMHVGQAGSPVADQRIRCAMTAAINPQDTIDALQAGVNKVANGPFSPSQPGYLADPGNQKFDMAKAKELVAAYTAEKGKPKIIYTTTNDSSSLSEAQIYQAAWKEAGMDVEIKQLEQSQLIVNALLGADDFNVFGWRNHAGRLDRQFLWWDKSQALPSGQLALNFGRLNDPVINDALAANRKETDPAKKKALAEQINQEFAKQCWIIPIYWTLWGIPHSPKVMGLSDTTFPDSDKVVSVGQGFPGSFLLTQAWIAP